MNAPDRRDMYKSALDPRVACNNRKRQSNDIRKQARERGIAQRRGLDGNFTTHLQVVEEPVAQTTSTAPTTFLDQVSKWKHSIWTGSEVEIQRTCFEVLEALTAVCEKRFVLEDAISSLNFMQIVYHVFRLSRNGAILLPKLAFFAQALCSPHAEIVRFSCLTIINALDTDDITYLVHEAMWMDAPSSIVDIILAVLPSQRDDVQRVMMLCLKGALQQSEAPGTVAHRVPGRTAKFMPFLVAALGSADLLQTALDCVSEIALTATLEELDHIRGCGVLATCISIIGSSTEEQADAIMCAIETIDSFASCNEDEPSAWLIAGGVLDALAVLADAEWISPDLIACICRITSNLAQSATEAVLAATSLCDTIVMFLEDDDLDDAVREEAFTVIECLTMTNGKPAYCVDVPYVLDATQADALYNLGALTVLVDVARTIARSSIHIRQRVLMCLTAMLDTLPQHAEEFAVCGGMELLKNICMTDGKYTLTGNMAAKILKQHFPFVFSSAAHGEEKEINADM